MWSVKFKEHLARGGEPRFAVDFQSPDLLKTDTLTDQRYVLHSHTGPAATGHWSHAIETISGTGQRVTIRSWKSSMGGLRVNLSSVKLAQSVAMNIPRGMMAELKVGFEGFSYEEFQTVGFYAYRGLSGSRNNWTMDFIDGISLLQAKPSVHLSSQFYKQAGANKAKVLAGYSASSSSATSSLLVGPDDLSVPVTTENFPKDSKSGARGLLYCEPTDPGTEPFYLKFTQLTSSTFTVVNTNVLDTVRYDLDANDLVTVIGYVQDSIPDVAQALLFGSRVGTTDFSGAVTMPDSWHCNLDPKSHLVDGPDMNRIRSIFLDEYANFEGELIVSAPMENPFRGIEEFLSAFGWWLVMHEGSLSYRFVQRTVPAGGHEYNFCAEFTITDSDIVSEDGYQLYSQDAPDEAFQVNFPNGHMSEDVKTLPGTFRLNHASRSYVFNDDVLSSNKLNSNTNMRGRLLPWYTRIPDQLTLTLKSWKFAELVPGDVVSLDSRYLYNMVDGARGYVGGTIFRDHSGTQYLVTGVDINWNRFSVTVQLSIPPSTP